MRQKRILTIIDLQSDYLELIDHQFCQDMMEYIYKVLRTQKYDLIINVSYGDILGKSTDRELNKILSNTKNVFYVSKEQNDGSVEILDAIEAKGYTIENSQVEIVGVNSDACVIDTVRGLWEKWHRNTLVHRKGIGTLGGRTVNEKALVEMCRNYGVVTMECH